MQRQEQTNTFQDGIISDMHPLSATNTSMTDALNATIVTYNGNEMILQNDMGNAKLFEDDEQTKPVRLTGGFEPIGVKEHGGILYIASIDKEGNFELGSFPGPEFQKPDDLKVYALKHSELLTTPTFTTGYYDNVFPMLSSSGENIIKNSNLYKNIPLVDEQGNPCILKVGQQYIIKVLDTTLVSDTSNKKLYKIVFKNLNTGKDITENIKNGVLYKQKNTFSNDITLDKYFPNIANTKLGISFEFEDIDIFQLGQTLEIKNDTDDNSYDNSIKLDDKTKKPILDVEYNGGRYPQLTNKFDVIFQTIEYKTSSSVKATHFYIKWELISNIPRNIDKEKLKGSFYGSLNTPILSTNPHYKNVYYLLQDNKEKCVIKLPTGDKQYTLKYQIYPIDENISVFNCLKNKELNLHDDYKRTFKKHVIDEEINLELNPSLWGSQGEYISLDIFKDNRYLSRDLYESNADTINEVSIPLSFKDRFYYIQPNGGSFPINDSKTNDSFQYVKCLNPDGIIETVFKNIGTMSEYRPHYGAVISINTLPFTYQALSLYKGKVVGQDVGHKPPPNNGEPTDSWKQTGTAYCYGELKCCKVYNFKHYNKISKTYNISNLNYFNLKNVKFISSIKYGLNAQKLATRKIVNNTWDWEKLPHIEYEKQGFSPLCQQPILNIQNSNYEYNPQYFDTWKILPVPGGGAPYNKNYGDVNYRLSAFFGQDGAYNNNDIINTTYDKGVEEILNTNTRNITLVDGDINLNIQNHIFALFAKNNTDGNECFSPDDINQEYDPKTSSVKSFLQNSNPEYPTLSLYYKGEGLGHERARVGKFTHEDGSSDVKGYFGRYVTWYYDYDTTGTELILPNNLNQKIQLALVKSRIKDNEQVYLDSFNNTYTSFNEQTCRFIEDPNKDFQNSSINKSKFNRMNKIFKDSGYPIGVLASYPINTGNYYNFTSLHYEGTVSILQKEYTYKFNNPNLKSYVNVRFYVAYNNLKSGPNSLEISVKGLSEVSYYIQDEKSETTSVNSINPQYLKSGQYYLVQVIGQVNQNEISITFKNENINNIDWYIRNVVMFDQQNNLPFKTYAISTYSSDKVLCNIKAKILKEDPIYCYLPAPNYFIDQTNPTFTVEDGFTTINGTKIQIIQ